MYAVQPSSPRAWPSLRPTACRRRPVVSLTLFCGVGWTDSTQRPDRLTCSPQSRAPGMVLSTCSFLNGEVRRCKLHVAVGFACWPCLPRLRQCATLLTSHTLGSESGTCTVHRNDLYQVETFCNDVAVLELNSSAVHAQCVGDIVWPGDIQYTEGLPLEVMGWGYSK